MARYIGPKCKLSRREGTDLQLNLALNRLTSKLKNMLKHLVNMAGSR
jgi:small subunit ribosomal protein S4